MRVCTHQHIILTRKNSHFSCVLRAGFEPLVMESIGSRGRVDCRISDELLWVEHNLIFGKHFSSAASKATLVLGIIKRTFDFLDCQIFINLYSTLVRPILDYASAVWNPYLRKVINNIEGVQRRATKLVKSLKDLSDRRRRCDHIQTFRIIKAFDNIPSDKLFHLVDSSTRGSKYTLSKDHCHTTPFPKES